MANITNFSNRASLTEDISKPYCVSCWDEYGQDGYSYFEKEKEAKKYASSLVSKVDSISIDIVDADGHKVKNIFKWTR